MPRVTAACLYCTSCEPAGLGSAASLLVAVQVGASVLAGFPPPATWAGGQLDGRAAGICWLLSWPSASRWATVSAGSGEAVLAPSVAIRF